MKDFAKLEERTDIKFKNKDIFTSAFTHRSYLNENPSFGFDHNERLEFLGDAVLELIVTEYLYTKYPKKNEGEMTALRASLVNTNMLSEVANEIGIGDFLFLSRGESKDTGRARQYILANTMESFMGAVYLDQGIDKVKSFLHKFLFPHLKKIIENKLWIDSKSLFQEKSQEFLDTTPTYKLVKDWGPDHAKNFVVGVYVNEEKIAEGEGASKQEAEQDAARNALDLKNWDK